MKLYSGSEPTVPPQPPQSISSRLFLMNCHKFQLLVRNLLDEELLQSIVSGLPGSENSLSGVSGTISRLFSLSADVRLNKRSFVLLPCDAAPSQQGAALSSPVTPVFVRDNFCSRAVVFIGNIWLWFLPCSDFHSEVKLDCC